MRITVAALMTTEWIAKQELAPARRHGPRHDPRAVRGRRCDAHRAARRPGGEGAEGPARDPPAFRARRARRRLRRLADRDPRRDQQCAADGAAGAPRAGGVLPRERGRCHRHRLHARPSRTPSSRASCTSSPVPGFRVSVDSFDPGEITTALDAGAEMVLSVNASNIDGRRALRRERQAVRRDSRCRATSSPNWSAASSGSTAGG